MVTCKFVSDWSQHLSLRTELKQTQSATTEEIGRAEAHKANLVFKANEDDAAPPWLADLLKDVAALRSTMERVEKKVDKLEETGQKLVQAGRELPIMLANGNAGPRGPLLDPTQVVDGLAPLLTAPNPTTRDQLMSFSGMLALVVLSSFVFLNKFS